MNQNLQKRPKKLLDQACTEPCPEPAEGLSKYPRSHPPETLLHSRGKGRQSVRIVRCPARRAEAGGRESASRFLLGPLAAEEVALGNGCSAPGLASATVTSPTAALCSHLQPPTSNLQTCLSRG